MINEIAGKKNDKSNLVDYLKMKMLTFTMQRKLVTHSQSTSPDVGEKFANKIPASTKSISEYLKLMGSNTKSIFLQPTHENEIRKIAFDLPSKASCGHERVSNVLLKENNYTYRRTTVPDIQPIHTYWGIPR